MNALSLPDCLAKTYGETRPGRCVLNHCQIVGLVAKELIARMPEWLRNDLFPDGSELIAACHDIGKVSPTFQKKIYRATHDYQKNPKPELNNIDPDLEKTWGGHAGVSLATADALAVGRYIPEILGQHHGYSPPLSHLATDAVFGGLAWQQQRATLVSQLKILLACDFPKVNSPEHARVLAGLTTVADWIGSSSLFDDPATDGLPLIDQALDKAGFIAPKINTGLSFFDIFNFQPHPSQTQLFNHAHQAGVYILEAPMGLGKTEAALYAAYKALSAGNATGIYFALPTQLTSDKIHDRVNAFLNNILVADSPHQRALLLHGNAWLKATELGVEGNPNGSWFAAHKRGLLAPFAVGTLDQALMAVMNVKHGFVRTFGLAGKVVILDEVHSYDAYTGAILEELVQQLRKLHCTVILLSATLSQERREKLLAEPVTNNAYPLISAKPQQAGLLELSVADLANKPVIIYNCHDEQAAVDQALDRAEQGQQVLWIENTVADAQTRFRLLNTYASNMGIACGLLHSRFLKTDRENNENHWVALYGKNNAQNRQQQGRILIGTQVLEQSLDIDADFLVSRFAPTDMLLQRIGRLWRHDNTLRPAMATREAWLLVPELNAAIADLSLFGASAKVYNPYVLCRSLEVWQTLTTINLPSDIRGLIEATYKTRDETGKMQTYQFELEQKRARLKQLARSGLAPAGGKLPESASTRYSEQDSVPVLLLRRYQHRADNTGTDVTLLNHDQPPCFLPAGLKNQDPAQWRQLAAELLKNTVQVAGYLAPKPVDISTLAWLKDYFYLGDPTDKDSRLRIALVDDSNTLKSLVGGAVSDQYQLSYDNKRGYQAQKRED